MSTETVWAEPDPKCDLCKSKGVDRAAAYDASLTIGCWALVCEQHFQQYGLGLGTGRGQRLVKEPDVVVCEHCGQKYGPPSIVSHVCKEGLEAAGHSTQAIEEATQRVWGT
jgi:hypothetical protein